MQAATARDTARSNGVYTDVLVGTKRRGDKKDERLIVRNTSSNSFRLTEAIWSFSIALSRNILRLS